MDDFKSLDPQTADHLVSSIVKALAYQENGGKLDLSKISAGKTGEMKSIFQFLPATWKGYAKEVLGDENAPLNNENETKVVYEKVKKWLEDDMSVKQIASMWNAGTGEPDAYTGKFGMTTKTHKAGDPSKGILQKSKVAFDVPTYANNVNDYAQKFFKERTAPQSNISQLAPNPAYVTKVPEKVPEGKNPTEMIGNFLSQMVNGTTAHASAMEQPEKTNPTNMPLMQQNAPAPEELKTPNSQNMGLLGRKPL